MTRTALILLLAGALAGCSEAPSGAATSGTPTLEPAPASDPSAQQAVQGSDAIPQAAPEAVAPASKATPPAPRPTVPVQAAAPPPSNPLDAARRVTPAELKALADAGEVVIVDVRNHGQWDAGRIAGAVHIPYGELFERAAELPREKWVAFYCT